MRNRPEILGDATRLTGKKVLLPQFSDRLSLLTLEVLIDIRDALVTDCKDAMNALIEIRKTH